jgi:hypothetical protein
MKEHTAETPPIKKSTELRMVLVSERDSGKDIQTSELLRALDLLSFGHFFLERKRSEWRWKNGEKM